jgi:hypothetical protein
LRQNGRTEDRIPVRAACHDDQADPRHLQPSHVRLQLAEVRGGPHPLVEGAQDKRDIGGSDCLDQDQIRPDVIGEVDGALAGPRRAHNPNPTLVREVFRSRHDRFHFNGVVRQTMARAGDLDGMPRVAA